MNTIFDYWPYALGLAAMFLTIRFLFGASRTKAKVHRPQTRPNIYRWDDKSAHRD